MTNTDQYKQATLNLWKFTTSKFISAIGSSVYTFGIGLYVLMLTGSATGFAITLVCGSVPRILFAPIAGHLADKFPRKLIVVTAQLSATLIMSTVLITTIMYELYLPLIYVTAALLAICSTFSNIGLTSSIPNIIDSTRIQKIIAFNQSATSSASILGPVLGGLMFGVLSIEIFLLIYVISYAITTTLEMRINFNLYMNDEEENETKKSKDATLWISIKEGYKYVYQTRLLFVVVTTAFWVNFFAASLFIGLPFIVVQELEVSVQQFGLIEGALAVGMLVMSILLSVRKEFQNPINTMRNGLLLLSAFIASIAIPLLISFEGLGLLFYYMGVALLIGSTLVFINTPLMVSLQKNTPEKLRGRVFALIETIASAIAPIGMILYGFIFDLLPAEWVVFSSSLTLFCITLYGLRSSQFVNEQKEKKISAVN
ncbi:MFS transporter [Jeotgalibacillus marinus]|uniref:MFS transporter n=1 Tax=Jeotgalibacillus marinus TaxID=86667 RepID=A0ABV3Q5Q1_9BACL